MATPASRARTTAGVLLVLAVAFYAPLTFTYFWSGPTGPNFQDRVFEFLISPSFAFGFGSGHDGGPNAHFHTFVANYATLWVHSVVGTVALVAGLSQFSDRLRRSRPAVHRTLGKVFILCCFAVAVTASIYLLRVPATKVFSGRVFEEVLWLLASGTAGLAILAFVSIRRRDLVAHREFATGAFALICSAGLLRIQWLTIDLVWSPGKEMLNLAAIQFAACILITGAMLYVSRFWKGERGADAVLPRPVSLRIAAAIGVVGVVALAIIAGTVTDWSAPHPYWFSPGWGPIVALAFVPWALHTTWLAVMAGRAGRQGRPAAYAAWRTYLLGGLTGPGLGALGYGFGVLALGMDTQEAWYIVGYMWGTGLVTAYVAHATLTTRWARRPARAAATETSGELQPV